MNSIESKRSLVPLLAAFKQALRQFGDPLHGLVRLDAQDQLPAFSNLQLPLVDFDPFDQSYPAGTSASRGQASLKAAGPQHQAPSGYGTTRSGSSGGHHEALQNHAVWYRPHPPDKPEHARVASPTGTRSRAPDRCRIPREAWPPSVPQPGGNGDTTAGASPPHSGPAAAPKSENGRRAQSHYGVPGKQASFSQRGEACNDHSFLSSLSSAVPMSAFKQLNELTQELLAVNGPSGQERPFDRNRPLASDSPAPPRPPAAAVAGGRSQVVSTPPPKTRGSLPPRQVENAPAPKISDTGARPFTGVEEAVARTNSCQPAKKPGGIESRKTIDLVAELTAVQGRRSFSPAANAESPVRHDKSGGPACLQPNAPDRSGPPVPAALSQAPVPFAPFPDEQLLAQHRPYNTHLAAEQLTDLINDVLVSQARRHGVDL